MLMIIRAAKVRFDEDEDFKTRARAAVGLLQGGAPEYLKAWERICNASRLQFEQLYSRLNVNLTERGESFYNPLLQPLVSELLEREVAVESQEAKVMIKAALERFLSHIDPPQPKFGMHGSVFGVCLYRSGIHIELIVCALSLWCSVFLSKARRFHS